MFFLFLLFNNGFNNSFGLLDIPLYYLLDNTSIVLLHNNFSMLLLLSLRMDTLLDALYLLPNLPLLLFFYTILIGLFSMKHTIFATTILLSFKARFILLDDFRHNLILYHHLLYGLSLALLFKTHSLISKLWLPFSVFLSHTTDLLTLLLISLISHNTLFYDAPNFLLDFLFLLFILTTFLFLGMTNTRDISVRLFTMLFHFLDLSKNFLYTFALDKCVHYLT